MDLRLVLCGLAIWAAATAVLRLAGQRLLHPGDWIGPLILFAVSFPLMTSLDILAATRPDHQPMPFAKHVAIAMRNVNQTTRMVGRTGHGLEGECEASIL